MKTEQRSKRAHSILRTPRQVKGKCEIIVESYMAFARCCVPSDTSDTLWLRTSGSFVCIADVDRGGYNGDMIEALKEWLYRRPFEPFRVVLSSGDSYEVRHPEVALLIKGGLYIGLPADNGDVPDRAAFCAMLHITAIEPLVSQPHP